jgi:HEPN domain-containing protein
MRILGSDESPFCVRVNMDVDRQIEYWKTGSAEDLAAAESLLEKGHWRHCLFFAHLALEKMLKAHVVHATRADPPRIHNLVRLARMAGLKPNDAQEKFLRRFDLYQLEGRYPDSQQVVLNAGLAREELQKAAEILQWLKTQFAMP